MAFQVSPGVSISEIDATNALAPSSSSNAGFASAFLWGPADKIVSISSEQDLANHKHTYIRHHDSSSSCWVKSIILIILMNCKNTQTSNPTLSMSILRL